MTIILILAALTLLLGLIEIFLMPGFGLAGIASAACALVDLTLIYNTYGVAWAVAALIAGVSILGIALRWMTHAKRFDKMALNTSIDSTNATEAQLSVQVGEKGIAITRLALIGNAEINGKQVEVKSAGSFIEPNTPIKVVAVNEALITVKPLA